MLTTRCSACGSYFALRSGACLFCRNLAEASGSRGNATQEPGLASLEASLRSEGHVARRLAAFVRKHWQGRYSLARAFWLNKLIACLVGLGANVILAFIAQFLTLQTMALAIVGLTAAFQVATVWYLVGVWRSATRHIAEGGRFGRLAKLVLVLIGTASISKLAASDASLDETWALLRGDQLGPPLSVRLSEDGASLYLSGGINEGTADALTSALESAASVRTVVLDSGGGWLREGLAAARVIAARGLDTRVNGECSSACTLMFLAGRARALGVGARVGFHRFSDPALTADARLDTTQTRDVYRATGLSPAFVERVVGTLPDQIWYPTLRELLQAGIATNTHEWDAARSDLEPDVREAARREFGHLRLSTQAFEQLVACELSRTIERLNRNGCEYALDEDEMGDGVPSARGECRERGQREADAAEDARACLGEIGRNR